MHVPPAPSPSRAASTASWRLAVLVWVAGAAALVALDGVLDVANEALLLVLTAAVASVWLPPSVSVVTCAVAVVAFDVGFVPPRGRFSVDLTHHALLLATTLGVSWIVSLLMARQRTAAAEATLLAARADERRRFGDTVRDAGDTRAAAESIRQRLEAIHGAPVAVLVAPPAGADATPLRLGTANHDEWSGLRVCREEGRAQGPGTGRYEAQPARYVPLRGGQSVPGAALFRSTPGAREVPLDHLQALCDQWGAAIEREDTGRAAEDARRTAELQSVRSTLLTAIAHDHRTPLAAILGAASSLHDQDDRLTPDRRQRLAATIIDEATQLTRLTENTLQLARLGAPGVTPARDWESAEEIVGTVVRRARRRDPAARIRVRVPAPMPLLYCDAVLLVQLLENLVDNALRHGTRDGTVEIVARCLRGFVMLGVRDRGPGLPQGDREAVFDLFRRGTHEHGPDAGGGRRGMGIGLAVARVIARVHGGELRYRARRGGGAAFECWLPVSPAPDAPPPDSAP